MVGVLLRYAPRGTGHSSASLCCRAMRGFLLTRFVRVTLVVFVQDSHYFDHFSPALFYAGVLDRRVWTAFSRAFHSSDPLPH